MVVDSLFLIAPDVCRFLCLVPVFVMQYLMSFLVIPPANFVCRGYNVFTLSVRPCVRPSVRNALFP